ncbi:hypothetical protein BJF85_21850 [Saccharomonospora sp. CUA-673]|nr:hypothetical protein BJF85_21850 [Saccharomonospora sp. CUA-673]
MALLHATAAVALAKIAVVQPGDTTFARAAALALLVGSAALWASLDGWMRRPDGGRTWFITGLAAGPLSGLLSVIGRAVFVDNTSTSELGPALTSGAAFTALLIILPAGLGLFVGGRLPRPGGDLDDTGDAGDAGDDRRTPASTAAASETPADSTDTEDAGDAGATEDDHEVWKAPAVAEIPSTSSTARARTKPDEREETVLLKKPRPHRRPRPAPRDGSRDTGRTED